MNNILVAILLMFVVSLILGLILVLVHDFFDLKNDSSIDVKKIEKLLPKIDCGGCGYVTCKGFARALHTKKEKTTTLCKVLKNDDREKLKKEIKKYKRKEK